jgi:hypothetical protein
MTLLTRYCHLKAHLLKLVGGGGGLVNSRECDSCKQTLEMASCVLCESEAPVVLKFTHLGHNFLNSGNFADIFFSKALHLFKVQGY